MPIIVPIEENHEGIAGLTDAKFRAPDTSGSGLEALGAALAKLGEGGEQFAGALDEKRKHELAAIAAIAAAKLDDDHQRNIDDAAVKKAYVGYSDQTHEALRGDNGLFKQRGADAHAAFPDLIGKLIDNHDKVLAPLDEAQRAAIAPVLGARLRSDVDLAADHVRAQGKAEQKLQSQKLQQAAGRDAVANPGDPDLHDHHIATGENAIRQQAMLNGTSDKELDQRLAGYRSAVTAASTDALAARDANAIDRDQRFRDARPALNNRPAKALPVVPGAQSVTSPNEPDAAWQTTPYALTPAMAYRLAPGTSALRPGIDFARR
ncbi:MAG: hypothetical protein JWL96_590 [Sphingomonas bacterium]|uniref:hypothetical protein n=1 Tax=Sphingomonas bacterium TaxID=1895847 RepID=UPI00261188E7|nr:hypothetical protein [Sphingomonas bacterium]MDB5708520.1 hypothetical protein [Sphingomonas bacterium]